MRLCNALIQYSLFISLSLLVHNCYGQEHPNHVDPVATKYSESAATVDPQTKPIETANVQKNDFPQHNEDEHLHDTIEARLQAKHHLRQSVHQHADDDKHETEQDYIDRLNSALETDYKVEHHFQYAAPPIADKVNNTPSQNQTEEAVQVPFQVQNETTSSTSTSLQTPPEQKQPISEGPSTAEAPAIVDTSKNVPILDEKPNLKVISEEIIPPVQVQTIEQQTKDPIPQNVVKEDILFVHKETVSTIQSQQKEETPNATKSINDSIPSPSDQQQPLSKTTVDEILLNNSTLDAEPSSPTPSQTDQLQQVLSDSAKYTNLLDLEADKLEQPPSGVTQTGHSSDTYLEQLTTPEAIQNASSLDVKRDQQESTPEQIQAPNSNLEQPKTSEAVQNASSLDAKLDQNQPTLEQIPATQSPNSSLEQPKTVDKVPNNSSLNVKSEQEEPTPKQMQTSDPILEQLKTSEPTQNASSLDAKPDQQQPISEPTQTNSSTDAKLEQSKTSEPVQNASSLDVKPDQQESTSKQIPPSHINLEEQNTSSLDIKSDQQEPKTSDLNLEQSKTVDAVQKNNSLEQNASPPTPLKSNEEQLIPNLSEQEKSTPEILQNTSSTDKNVPSVQESQQPPPIIDTPNPTENVVNDVKSEDISSVPKEQPILARKSTPPPRVLRSATSRIQERPPPRQRTAQIKPEEPKVMPTIEITVPTIEEPVEEHNHSIESPSTSKPEEQLVQTFQSQSVDLDINNDTETQINDDQTIEPIDTIDLPRQVHVHDPKAILEELKEEINKNEHPSLDEQIENNATVDSFLVNDHSPHLPRILDNEETISTIDSVIPPTTNTPQAIESTTETNPIQNDSKTEETNSSLTLKSNISDITTPIEYRQVCWRLPKPLEPSLGLVENQVLRFINFLPEFLQTTFFGRIDDRETLMNTIWFGSICSICFLFSLIFLSLGAKRLKQSKREKEVRARCQQLQQYNNQIELERATFERQNQKLSDEIDELKNLPVRDADEEIFELREKYEQLHADWKIGRSENDALQRDIDYKQSLIQKHEFEMQKQVETVAYLNDEILRQKQELGKERETIARVQSNDLSLERFEKLQTIIHELKSEITQLKQDKFAQTDQLQQVQDHAKQLDLDNNELTIKMKQLKDLLEQRDETIARIREKMLDDNDDEEKTTEIGDILFTVTEHNADSNQQQQQQELLSTIDNDVEKANQHMRNLHSEIEEKTRRVKELDALLNQEKDKCRELETKLKVVLELRERDAHLHIRQLGQTDAELRKARTDTERVRILQQQLELKQQQLDDVQRVLGSEQTKFSEECSKLQHETHEKWMEVKRLTRELDGARKECEGLRRQITKYANSDRSSQEKTMHKPVPHHLNNTGRLSSEPETNGSSPPLHPYQQGDNFRPIDHERNDSGAASPAEMLRFRPSIFGLARPPFFPPPFMPPPPNPFMMAPRFPMPGVGPHGMISPIPHLMTNGSGGGSDTNSFEIVDSTNITPNSTSYDVQLNGSAVSPVPNDEQQATAKPKKAKKSLKKKTKTSGTTTVSNTKEDV